MSWMRGMGWQSSSILYFNRLQLTHSLRLPSFFLTHTTGNDYGDFDLLIYPRLIISCRCFLTSSYKGLGIELCVVLNWVFIPQVDLQFQLCSTLNITIFCGKGPRLFLQHLPENLLFVHVTNALNQQGEFTVLYLV